MYQDPAIEKRRDANHYMAYVNTLCPEDIRPNFEEVGFRKAIAANFRDMVSYVVRKVTTAYSESIGKLNISSSAMLGEFQHIVTGEYLDGELVGIIKNWPEMEQIRAKEDHDSHTRGRLQRKIEFAKHIFLCELAALGFERLREAEQKRVSQSLPNFPPYN